MINLFLIKIQSKKKLKNFNKEEYVDLDDLLGNKPQEQKGKIICTCFQITEDLIWDAIKQNGLKTVDEVTNYTKAGGACGRCKGIIKDIIETYLKKNKAEEKVELTPTQKILKIGKVLEQQISPQLQKDGGDIELVDIDGDIVKVKLIGVCSACKNASMTLKNFVEAELKEKVDSKIIVEQV